MSACLIPMMYKSTEKQNKIAYFQKEMLKKVNIFASNIKIIEDEN